MKDETGNSNVNVVQARFKPEKVSKHILKRQKKKHVNFKRNSMPFLHHIF
jgi:hypothetical protein